MRPESSLTDDFQPRRPLLCAGVVNSKGFADVANLQFDPVSVPELFSSSPEKFLTQIGVLYLNKSINFKLTDI